MRATRVIACAVMAASIGLIWMTDSRAQSLRSAQTPAEFPPATFKGKQFVDSKGCIYIRAGIDGNVTWVPRVNRSRKVVCGYKPSFAAGEGTKAAARAPAAAPVQITLAPSDAPREATPAPKPARTPSPKPTAAPRPAPKPTRVTAPAPAAKPAPKPKPAPAPVRAVAPTQIQRGGTCPNASAFSQQFINDGSRFPVRCGPQAEPPVVIIGRKSSALAPGLAPMPSPDPGLAPVANPAPYGATNSGSVRVTQKTRVVPRHVYDNRRNTLNVTVPQGYRTVWADDRLNPKRAERTLVPDAPRSGVSLPAGYRMAWEDDRLNPARGTPSAAGDAQTDRIWTRTLPRTLIRQPTDVAVIEVPRSAPVRIPRARTQSRPVTGAAPTPQPRARRGETATGSAAAPAGKPRYVRVATYRTEAEARSVAQSLARGGLPMRLGHVTRKGAVYKVVLAGPFPTRAEADTALARVRGAGFRRASINR